MYRRCANVESYVGHLFELTTRQVLTGVYEGASIDELNRLRRLDPKLLSDLALAETQTAAQQAKEAAEQATEAASTITDTAVSQGAPSTSAIRNRRSPVERRQSRTSETRAAPTTGMTMIAPT